jgi:hypothetical protein
LSRFFCGLDRLALRRKPERPTPNAIKLIFVVRRVNARFDPMNDLHRLTNRYRPLIVELYY